MTLDSHFAALLLSCIPLPVLGSLWCTKFLSRGSSIWAALLALALLCMVANDRYQVRQCHQRAQVSEKHSTSHRIISGVQQCNCCGAFSLPLGCRRRAASTGPAKPQTALALEKSMLEEHAHGSGPASVVLRADLECLVCLAKQDCRKNLYTFL